MYLEIAIIGLQTLVLTGIMIILARGMARTILTALLELDHKIAEAIQQVVSGGFESPEPPNPIQQMLFEVIKNNMAKKEPNVELVRGEDGKFK
jgi:hypothetical protein